MISIITPTYNSGAYLEKCIQSIVNQEFDDYEHIIVDGGSTDNTLAIIKKYESLYNIKWISEKDNGMYDAISKGFKMAKGDILCWLNSDDIYMPWTLKVVEHVFQNTDIDWCTGVPTQINENGEIKEKVTDKIAEKVTVKKDKTTFIEFENNYDLNVFDVEIDKTDISGTKEVDGAKLKVIDEEGNLVERWISGQDDEKTHKLKLSPGKYTFQLRHL